MPMPPQFMKKGKKKGKGPPSKKSLQANAVEQGAQAGYAKNSKQGPVPPGSKFGRK